MMSTHNEQENEMTTETLTAPPPSTSDAPARIALSLDRYRLLGRSGLRVSPLALGTMTFGLDWGWGAERDEARRMFDLYLNRGGNFIDTANNYTNGSAERLIGEFARDRRERLVIATKYTCWTRQGDPNAGGNHRKSMIASVESSLRRLGTDYIDLLYLHVWDGRRRSRRSCAGWTTWCAQGRCCTSGSPIPPRGRCRGCRRSLSCAAGRR